MQSDALRRSLKDDILEQLVRRNSLVKSPVVSPTSPASRPQTPPNRRPSTVLDQLQQRSTTVSPTAIDQRRSSTASSPVPSLTLGPQLASNVNTRTGELASQRASSPRLHSPILSISEIPSDRRASVDLAIRIASPTPTSPRSTASTERRNSTRPATSPIKGAIPPQQSPSPDHRFPPEPASFRSSIQSPVTAAMAARSVSPTPDKIALMDEIARLRVENDSLELRLSESQAQSASMREIQKQMKELRTERDQLKKQLLAAQQENRELRDTVDHHSGPTVREQLEKLQKNESLWQRASLRTALARTAQQLESVRSSRETEKKRNTQTIEFLRREVASLTQQLHQSTQTASREKKAFEGHSSVLARDLSDLEHKHAILLAERDDEIAQLREQIEEYEALLQQVSQPRPPVNPPPSSALKSSVRFDVRYYSNDGHYENEDFDPADE